MYLLICKYGYCTHLRINTVKFKKLAFKPYNTTSTHRWNFNSYIQAIQLRLHAPLDSRNSLSNRTTPPARTAEISILTFKPYNFASTHRKIQETRFPAVQHRQHAPLDSANSLSSRTTSPARTAEISILTFKPYNFGYTHR